MINLATLTYRQKGAWIETIYLLILCVLVPLAMGIQIFTQFSHTLSYVLLNIMLIPVIMLFYKYYLERILFREKWILSVLLLPVYLFVFDVWVRITYFIMIWLPFVPQSYKVKLMMGHPDDFGSSIQNFVYTLIILLSTLVLGAVKKLIQKHDEVRELHFEQLRLQLENLRAQVQPHFFFNTLNNLYNLSLKNSPLAPVLISRLSAIMRYVIYEQQEKVPLTKEIEFMENYFELERIRHTGQNLIDFSIQGDPSSVEIEPLLFLPIIENCFKHALQEDLLEHPVKIVLVVDDDELTFQTSNRLFEKSEKISQGGIGLNNVKRRLELLYGAKQQFEISTEADQYIATINIQR
ncbi:histidine kinase [Pedobacter duraquae]|uniref:Histidine kinase n=1 Tax=Pedobacter duraquae TaxID=425511 RepID=A0A4R6INT2_9SPHI|nr:histidine kinase [Pedobacter duraquae]